MRTGADHVTDGGHGFVEASEPIDPARSWRECAGFKNGDESGWEPIWRRPALLGMRTAVQ